MNQKKAQSNKALITRKIKTYKPEEIKAAGGADNFSKLTQSLYNTQKAIEALSQIALTEDEIDLAVSDLKTTK